MLSTRKVAAGFQAEGIRTAHVDGTTPNNVRDTMMQRFQDGDLDVICNYEIISEGFDAPDCDCIILGAPTASIVRYLQRAGRGMRPGEGKTTLILDLAGMSYYFGAADQPREWTLADGAIKPEKLGVLPFTPEDIRR